MDLVPEAELFVIDSGARENAAENAFLEITTNAPKHAPTTLDAKGPFAKSLVVVILQLSRAKECC